MELFTYSTFTMKTYYSPAEDMVGWKLCTSRHPRATIPTKIPASTRIGAMGQRGCKLVEVYPAVGLDSGLDSHDPKEAKSRGNTTKMMTAHGQESLLVVCMEACRILLVVAAPLHF